MRSPSLCCRFRTNSNASNIPDFQGDLIIRDVTALSPLGRVRLTLRGAVRFALYRMHHRITPGQGADAFRSGATARPRFSDRSSTKGADALRQHKVQSIIVRVRVLIYIEITAARCLEIKQLLSFNLTNEEKS
jgi:hypothetical protein